MERHSPKTANDQTTQRKPDRAEDSGRTKPHPVRDTSSWLTDRYDNRTYRVLEGVPRSQLVQQFPDFDVAYAVSAKPSNTLENFRGTDASLLKEGVRRSKMKSYLLALLAGYHATIEHNAMLSVDYCLQSLYAVRAYERSPTWLMVLNTLAFFSEKLGLDAESQWTGRRAGIGWNNLPDHYVRGLSVALSNANDEELKDSIRQGIALVAPHVDLLHASDSLLERASATSGEQAAELYEEAIAAWKRIEEFDPSNVDTTISMGCVYARAGNIDEASQWLEKALRMDPNNDRARRNLEAVKATDDSASQGEREEPAEQASCQASPCQDRPASRPEREDEIHGACGNARDSSETHPTKKLLHGLRHPWLTLKTILVHSYLVLPAIAAKDDSALAIALSKTILCLDCGKQFVPKNTVETGKYRDQDALLIVCPSCQSLQYKVRR